MTTIFKYSIYIFCSIFLNIVCAQAKIVKVDVTGYGVSREIAVIDGLKEAVAQVSGLTISSNDLTSLSSKIYEKSKKNHSLSQQVFSKEDQSDIATELNGYIAGYQILDSEKNKDGIYQVRMNIDIEKYDIPGLHNTRRSIAVLGFKANTGYCLNNNIKPKVQTEELSNALIKYFTSSRKFSVLDRDNKNLYQLEKNLILSEDAQNIEFSKLGLVKGTDYIITGKIKAFNVTSDTQSVSLTGEKYKIYHASIDVDFQLIAFASRQIKFASNVKISLSNNENNSGKCADILSVMMNKAAEKIVYKCLENIYPPLIIKVDGDNIYLNLGGDYVKKNSIYQIYNVGEKLIDPYTGESLGATETKVATMKITEIKPKYSVGKIETGNIKNVQQGQVCRFLEIKKN